MPPYPPPQEDVEPERGPQEKPLVINNKVKSAPSKNPLLRFNLSKKSPRGLVKTLAGLTGSNGGTNSKSQVTVSASPKVGKKSEKGLKKSSGSARQSRSRSRGGRHQIFGCTGGQRSRSCTPERNYKLSCNLPVHIPPDLLNLHVEPLAPLHQPDVTRSTEYPVHRDIDMDISHKIRPLSGENNNNPSQFDRQIQQMLHLNSMGAPLDDVTNVKQQKPHLRPEVIPMGTRVQRSRSLRADTSTYSKRHSEAIQMGTKVHKPHDQETMYFPKAEYTKKKEVIVDDDPIYSTATAIPDDAIEDELDKDKGLSVFFRRLSFKRKSGSKKKEDNVDGKKLGDSVHTKNRKNEYTDEPYRDMKAGHGKRRSHSADRRVERSPKHDSDYYNSKDVQREARRSQSFSKSRKSMKGRPLPPLPIDSTNEQSNSLSSQTTTNGAYYGNVDTTTSRSTVIYAEAPSQPPPQGSVSLVKTIHLDHLMKNKWISGLAVTKRGDYIVVDQMHSYWVDDEGNLKKVIGGKGNNKLNEPIDVTVMSNGNLAFSDHADQDVKLFNSKGQFLRRVKDQALTNIAGVASNNRGEIIIAGTDKKRLSVINENDELLYTLPSDKDSKVSFEHPYTVAVNPMTQIIIVGDDYRQLVTALSADGQKIMWRFSPSGGRDRHFFPSSICVDNDGYVFIADLYNEKVYMLDSGGKCLKTLLSRGDGLKGGPGAIATDGQGHLLVADEERTIKVFKYGENGFALYRRTSYGPCAHVC